MRRPTLIIFACLAFVLGTLLGYYFLFSTSYIWLVFVALSILVTFFISKPLRAITIILSFLILGVCLVTYRINYISQNGISGQLFKKLTVEGTVVGDPYWDKDKNYVFVINSLSINGQPKPESIKIKTFSSAVKEGNKVRVEGKIFPTLAKPGYSMSYAKVAVINYSQPLLVVLKNKLYTGVERSIGGEPANFIKGLLVGARSSLSQNTQDILNSTGLSHVVAVSGYNLTILVVLFQRLLKKKWAWASLVISLVMVWCFVALTGGSASIIRAAIMASVFLIAGYYGRPVSIFVCISITAVLTLAINPVAVAEDVGWQLSFLSLSGIVVLEPVIRKLLPTKPTAVFEIIAVTLAAQIATVPYIMSVFGKYSAVAIVANTVLMPIIPLLMLAGIIMALLGLAIPNSSYMLGRFFYKAIEYIFDFLKYLQSQRSLSVDSVPSMAFLIAWYTLIVIVGVIVYNKRPMSSFQKTQELVK